MKNVSGVCAGCLLRVARFAGMDKTEFRDNALEKAPAT